MAIGVRNWIALIRLVCLDMADSVELRQDGTNTVKAFGQPRTNYGVVESQNGVSKKVK
jgi:hypothetical protein